MTAQSQFGREAASIAADVIRAKAGSGPLALGITLGSGLGGLAGDIREAVVIPFAEIPGFPTATVIGHAGSVVVGMFAEKRIVALAGRFHMYEGHSPQLAAFPVRVMHALGARTYFASNAAGGIRKDLTAGDLMIIEDHLNLTGVNPLTGPVEINDDRFPDMTAPYDDDLRDLLKASAKKLGLPVKEGVYAWLPGPSFETKAEVRMLATLGADAVGMSTVPEVIVARAMGMRVAGMSCIANAASGIGVTPVLHSDVLEVTAKAAVGFQALVREFIAGLPPEK